MLHEAAQHVDQRRVLHLEQGRQGLPAISKPGFRVDEHPAQRLAGGGVAEGHAQGNRSRANTRILVRPQNLERVRPARGHGDLAAAPKCFLDPHQERQTPG